MPSAGGGGDEVHQVWLHCGSGVGGHSAGGCGCDFGAGGAGAARGATCGGPRRRGNLRDFRRDVLYPLLPRVRRRRGRRGHALHIRARRVLEREAQLIIKSRADGVEVARPRGPPMMGPRVVLVLGVPFRLERRLLLRHRDLRYCFWGDLGRAASLLRRRAGRRPAARRRLGRRQALGESPGGGAARGCGGAFRGAGGPPCARGHRRGPPRAGPARPAAEAWARAGAAFGSPLVHARLRRARRLSLTLIGSRRRSRRQPSGVYVVLGPCASPGARARSLSSAPQALCGCSRPRWSCCARPAQRPHCWTSSQVCS